MNIKMIVTLLLGWGMINAAFAQGSVNELETKLRQNPKDVSTLVSLGKAYHDQGASGNKDAVEQGMTCLDKALELDPGNSAALAYRGSLWTMRGRDAWWPFTKMKDVDKGIDEMDKAVDLAPTNPTVHIVRGINSVQLPSMFKRLPVALKDFDYLLSCREFAYFDPALQSTICLWAGIAYKHDDQAAKAKVLLLKAAALVPDSWMATKAKEELKELS
jgi:tetratricopeptide (TPR) repeat protein